MALRSTMTARLSPEPTSSELAMTNRDGAATEITALLHAHGAGDSAALELLLARAYHELRRIARRRLRRERAGHTLAATELVHEAFLKLVPLERVDWRNRAHFYAIASRAMRNVLVAIRRAGLAGSNRRIASVVACERVVLSAETHSPG